MTSGEMAKIAVWVGGGITPGYLWTVVAPGCVWGEFFKCFGQESQQEYIKLQVQDLARHESPTYSLTLNIDQVETFWELRDKGGGLGPKTNMRMYFDFVNEPHKCIRVLGFDCKKNEGKISDVVKDKIKRRQRNLNDGLYLVPQIPKKRAEQMRKAQAKETKGDSR